MKVTFMGTGTSDGIPVPACACSVCRSGDPFDERLRSGTLIRHNGKNIIIDVSPDFRMHALCYDLWHVDAVFLTHPHTDHIGGLDSLRRYNHVMRRDIPVYGNAYTLNEIKQRFSYFFNPPQRGGGVPKLRLIEADAPFELFNMKVTPIKVKHGVLDILGFRFGDFTFITDASSVSDESLELIRGSHSLCINALRYREHPTHFNLEQAVDFAYKAGAKRSFLIHFDHDVKHSRLCSELPSHIRPAYDGLSFEL